MEGSIQVVATDPSLWVCALRRPNPMTTDYSTGIRLSAKIALLRLVGAGFACQQAARAQAGGIEGGRNLPQRTAGGVQLGDPAQRRRCPTIRA